MVNVAGAKHSMCGHAKQTWLGTWSWQVPSTCCLVCFSFPPSSVGKSLLARAVEDLSDCYVSFFFFFLLLLPLLVLFFSNQCSFAKAFQLVRAALQNFQLSSSCPLLSGFSALFLLYLLPNNLSAQKHQVQFFRPCHQTIPLSCPLLPAVIAATHLLNPQASFHFQSNVPSGSFLEHLPWFCECFPVYIFHGGFWFYVCVCVCYFLCWCVVESWIILVFWPVCLFTIHNQSKGYKILLDHTFNGLYSLRVHIALVKMTTLKTDKLIFMMLHC